MANRNSRAVSDPERFANIGTDRIQQVVETLYGETWPTRGYDISCYEAIGACLRIMGMEAVIAGIREVGIRSYPCGPIHDESRLRQIISDAETRLISEIETRTAIWSKEGVLSPIYHRDVIFLDGNERRCIAFRFIFRRTGAGFSVPKRSLSGGLDVDFIAVVFRPEIASRSLGQDISNAKDHHQQVRMVEKLTKSNIFNVLLLFFDALSHRERRFAAFAPNLTSRYWSDVGKLVNEGAGPSQKMRNAIDSTREPIRVPWDSSSIGRLHCDTSSTSVRTASLSLDLRKSTHCMEQARSPKEFGLWLSQLTEILRKVCHLHEGVFDKFTGDGALVHFLDRECAAINGGRSATEAAVHCAVDMQLAVEMHMRRLRTILRLDSDRFGAGIGIDCDTAYWSHDHRDNPIVVGRGVVYACRLCDKAPRRQIRLTNSAYHEFIKRPENKLTISHAVRVKLATKEMADELEMKCWAFSVPKAPAELNLGKGQSKVQELCNRVYEAVIE